MKIRKLVSIYSGVILLLFFSGGFFLTLWILGQSEDDLIDQKQKIVTSIVADSIIEPLKFGSVIEARSRINSFIKQGVFNCAELEFEELPVSKCPTIGFDFVRFTTKLNLFSDDREYKNPVLTVFFDNSNMKSNTKNRIILFLIYILLFGFSFFIAAWIFIQKIVSEITILVDACDSEKSMSYRKVSLIYEFRKLRTKIEDYFKVKEETIVLAARDAVNKQVAHDIRSPLAALGIVSASLQNVPEEKRLLIRNSVQRINDIANDLLASTRKSAEGFAHQSGIESQRELILLPALIDDLVSEKRIQFRNLLNIQIEAELSQGFGAFIKADGKILQRVISNLINNAVEAFPSKIGEVTVIVQIVQQMVHVSVVDNGKGIPSDVLQKLGKVSFSHGKEGSDSGFGLGVFHAKKSIESEGGNFNIVSELNKGTCVEIRLPRVQPPEWFLSSILLKKGTKVLCLDDDRTIHQIWSSRFDSLGLSSNDLEFRSFSTACEFKEFVIGIAQKSSSQPFASVEAILGTNFFFLIDYELLGQSINGLNVIEELGIRENVALVTSRYDDLEIRKKCEELKVKILPKAMAGLVPIEFEVDKQKFDWILIDDDELTHLSWKIAATEHGANFIGFRTYAEFEDEEKRLDFGSVVYVDSNLGNGIKGEQIAEEIFKRGFREIHLTTGYPSSQFPKTEFIKSVLSKDPPLR